MARGDGAPIDSLQHAIDAFAESALIWYGGIMMKNDPMLDRAMRRYKAALDYIDEHSPTGRDILVPLLDDEEEEVRAYAAGALVDTHEQRVIEVFEDLCRTGITDARGTAVMALAFHDTWHYWGFGTLKRDPRHYVEPPGGADGQPTTPDRSDA